MQIRQASIEELVQVNAGIEEFVTPYGVEVFHERLDDRIWYGLVASDQDRLLAFKVGYAETDESFYSWLGGVLPEARRLGLARKLLHAQEAWVIEQGFRQIRVKSRNRYRGMLQLLLSEDYLITGIEPQDRDHDNRIWFTKKLIASN